MVKRSIRALKLAAIFLVGAAFFAFAITTTGITARNLYWLGALIMGFLFFLEVENPN